MVLTVFVVSRLVAESVGLCKLNIVAIGGALAV
jgi:hypothetical protein